MQHSIEDYTDSDLMVAISSPFNSYERQYELEAELNHRKWQDDNIIRHIDDARIQQEYPSYFPHP